MIENITGKKYNNLTVLKYNHIDKNRKSVWLCKCDCGNETLVTASNLRTNKTKSCGCLRSKLRFENLSGKIYNNIEILDYIETIKNKHYYNCKCYCGNIFKVEGLKLKSGHTKSCGCLVKNIQKSKIKNMIGFEFNNCVVIEQTDHIIHGSRKKVTWLCKCHCGNFFKVTGETLRSASQKSCGCLHWPKGEMSPLYNHDLTEEERSRDNELYRKWRLEVYKRDNFTCQCCKGENLYLNAHHIKSYKDNKELRYDLNNGISLCAECHTMFHKQYSYYEYNKFDLDEYIERRGE